MEPQRVVDAFWDLIRSPEIRSSDWLDYVRDTIRGSIEMHDPDASDYVEEGSASLIHYGTCLSDDQYARTMLGFQDDEITQWLDSLTPEKAHTIVFQGK